MTDWKPTNHPIGGNSTPRRSYTPDGFPPTPQPQTPNVNHGSSLIHSSDHEPQPKIPTMALNDMWRVPTTTKNNSPGRHNQTTLASGHGYLRCGLTPAPGHQRRRAPTPTPGHRPRALLPGLGDSPEVALAAAAAVAGPPRNEVHPSKVGQSFTSLPMTANDIDEIKGDCEDLGHNLSFALELEFLVYWKEENGLNKVPVVPLFTPEQEAARKVPAIVRPDGYHYKRFEFISEKMTNFFRERGFGLINEVPWGNTPNRFPEMYLTPTTGWDISVDSTVEEPGKSGFNRLDMLPGWRYHGMEVRTPILRNCQKSFDHIYEVITAIRENFRVRTNGTCGMHCHVGCGTELMLGKDQGSAPLIDGQTGKPVVKARTFPLQALRRMAALHWAADPFLAALHPPERQLSMWSPSIRLCSQLARGKPDVKPYKQQPKPSHPGPEEEEFENLDIKRISTRRFPALRPETFGNDALARLKAQGDKSFFETTFWETNYGKNVITTTLEGANMLLAADSKEKIADLLSVGGWTSGTRLNYNYAEYFRKIGCGGETTTWNRGTIEYREHVAGSTDPDVAIMWAAVCCHMTAFAWHASWERFNQVLLRLARAEAAALSGHRNRYDVISFIADIGLPKVASWYEERLRKAPMDHWYPLTIGFPYTPKSLYPPNPGPSPPPSPAMPPNPDGLWEETAKGAPGRVKGVPANLNGLPGSNGPQESSRAQVSGWVEQVPDVEDAEYTATMAQLDEMSRGTGWRPNGTPTAMAMATPPRSEDYRSRSVSRFTRTQEQKNMRVERWKAEAERMREHGERHSETAAMVPPEGPKPEPERVHSEEGVETEEKKASDEYGSDGPAMGAPLPGLLGNIFRWAFPHEEDKQVRAGWWPTDKTIDSTGNS